MIALANYIREHEQPPVDPDLIEARKIVAANCDGEAVEQVLSGYLDTRPAVIAALAAIKRGRELERGE